MEKPESSTGDESNGELEDRDPNSLNKHLQVCWKIFLENSFFLKRKNLFTYKSETRELV